MRKILTSVLDACDAAARSFRVACLITVAVAAVVALLFTVTIRYTFRSDAAQLYSRYTDAYNALAVKYRNEVAEVDRHFGRGDGLALPERGVELTALIRRLHDQLKVMEQDSVWHGYLHQKESTFSSSLQQLAVRLAILEELLQWPEPEAKKESYFLVQRQHLYQEIKFDLPPLAYQRAAAEANIQVPGSTGWGQALPGLGVVLCIVIFLMAGMLLLSMWGSYVKANAPAEPAAADSGAG